MQAGGASCDVNPTDATTLRPRPVLDLAVLTVRHPERHEQPRQRRPLVAQLNERPMRALGTTRRALFEELDRPALAL